MVSSNNNKNKEALKDTMDPRLEEEVKGKANDEVEEDPTPHPHATVANIGVVANPFNRKRNARMSTGGKIPHHALASRTLSSDTSNPFHTLIHKYQFERVPEA